MKGKKGKQLNWQVLLGLSFIALSAFFYFIHYVIFRDAYHIFIYLLGDIAFVPIEVLLVTLIIHRLLSVREKRSLLNKLNMVIGAFYSEVGTDLLRFFSRWDKGIDSVQGELMVGSDWSAKQFIRAGKKLKQHESHIECSMVDLGTLKEYLLEKRGFLLRLLENPNLLEHETFTELLWAVVHLTDELAYRKDITNLSGTDCSHLAGDIARAYLLLISEWLAYMRHLKNHYPYLFSLAVRINPFNPQAKAEVP